MNEMGMLEGMCKMDGFGRIIMDFVNNSWNTLHEGLILGQYLQGRRKARGINRTAIKIYFYESGAYFSRIAFLFTGIKCART
jgi:hypothetical protein